MTDATTPHWSTHPMSPDPMSATAVSPVTRPSGNGHGTTAVLAPLAFHDAAQQLAHLRHELHRVVVGQERVLERVLVALLAGGHCLLEGVPGLGKTLTVATLAQTLGGTFHRIQFTPDLIPSDLVGTRIYRPSTERFDVELGPVFANFILADEINRAPAKVQSALLEVMAERQVSLGGVTYPLPKPFLVLATQNPIESEGVYPLPEAQRDRFLMRIPVDYPTPAEEHAIVARAAHPPVTPDRILTIDDVAALQAATASVTVDPAVQDYAVRLVLATRYPRQHGLDEVEGFLAYGASPRASIGLVHAARALALLRGRSHALPQDVYDIAYDVLNHRLVMSFDAVAEGVTVDDVLVATLTKVTAPRTGVVGS
jgi:MoxR-like ATPase